MTYDELVASIKRYTNTDDEESFNIEIPAMVAAAEMAIAKQIDIDAEIANDHTEFRIAVGQYFVTVPTAYRGVNQFRISEFLDGPWFFLEMRARSWCDDYAPSRAMLGKPKYYCIFDVGTVLVVPSLDTSYYGEMSYQAYITGLSSTKQTTWISLNAPELLEEATLIRAAEFQKNPDRVAMHQARYTELLQSEQAQAVRRMRDDLRLVR